MLDIITLISTFVLSFCSVPIISCFSCLPCTFLSLLPLAIGVFIPCAYYSIFTLGGFCLGGIIIGFIYFILTFLLFPIIQVFTIILTCFMPYICIPLVCCIEPICYSMLLCGWSTIGAIIGGIIGAVASLSLLFVEACLILLFLSSALCSTTLVVCSLFTPIFISCIPFVGCFAIESMLSIGACCLVPISLPFCWLAVCPCTCWFGCPLYIGLSTIYYCLFCPLCFQIPYLLHYCGLFLSCCACNLIDLAWVVFTPLCTIQGFIAGMGMWILCPCCVCIPPLTFCFTGGMCLRKIIYLGCTFPFTCWLEPIYCCGMGLTGTICVSEICCLPFAYLCTIPLVCLSSLAWLGCAICQWFSCLSCGFLSIIGICVGGGICSCSGLGVSYCCLCSTCLTCPSFGGLAFTICGLAEKFGGFTFKGLATFLGCGKDVVFLADCLNTCILDIWTPIVDAIGILLGLP